ncbi:cupin domain-containing protein [Cronobacter turicensis]|nr:cupin domain-containing protein [Cronobacter turicensis]EKY3177542.1 cupin domain-containing protein [Cronobacter turicensis]ELQ6148287.1 cupin domain-containing protein [Cronobacter turicensis]ELQ6270698.1 cupin domain-containing protein [Cronobacter turicensis]ELY4523042.1 cupin domain-containing protein [Cronobacter turicensis]
MTQPCETLYLREPCGGVPNNALPVLLYRQVLPADADDAAVWFEQRFAQHQWPARWRYPVFTYTHFHTNTHEVLGIYAGEAQIQLGGEAGPVVTLRAGDAVLIPAGVGHKQIDASADFMAAGAYPEGLSPDKFLDEPAQLAQTRNNVAQVAKPARDPLFGAEGGLVTLW